MKVVGAISLYSGVPWDLDWSEIWVKLQVVYNIKWIN